jgi:NAD(P)-dependent dehydrogenase (short-subunit alcohol dehydrogenase family)
VKLSGLNAVVTGGASGIGQATAELFAAEGARVFIVDLDEKRGNEVVAGIKAAKGSAEFAAIDVTSLAATEAFFKKLGTVDVLVNCAGIAAIGSIEACSTEDFERVFRVNVQGTFNTMKAAVPLMKGKKGAIVNLASVASKVGIPDRLAYSMSKGAVHTMTMSVATDYVKHGIRCNAIAPGRVHTPFVDGFLAKNYPGREKEMFDKLSATQPVGRMGKPDEIARLALFLACDDSAFMTGTCVEIDGGFCNLKLN